MSETKVKAVLVENLETGNKVYMKTGSKPLFKDGHYVHTPPGKWFYIPDVVFGDLQAKHGVTEETVDPDIFVSAALSGHYKIDVSPDTIQRGQKTTRTAGNKSETDIQKNIMENLAGGFTETQIWEAYKKSGRYTEAVLKQHFPNQYKTKIVLPLP